MKKILSLLFLALCSSAVADGLIPPGANSNTPISPTGAGSAYVATLAKLTAQDGVLLDTFYQTGDADDTASLNRAAATGVPIICNRTYIVNNFLTGTIPQFILRGVRGKCVIQRTSASGSNFFNVAAASVYIDGVAFDSNKANVTANQWGVLLSAGGQNIIITNSIFKNNSGTLGSGLSILSTGPSAGGWFYLDNNEITGNTFNPLFLGSVTAGTVTRNYVHDNSNPSVVSSYLTASSTNYSSNIIVANNQFVRNTGSGLTVGGYGAPYSFTVPPAVSVSVKGNIFQDNSSYELTLQGDYLSAIDNDINQSASGVSVFGGIDCNSRYQDIRLNRIVLSGASYGIDCGGSTEANITSNSLTMNSGLMIDVGGNLNSKVLDNTFNASGTANAMTIYGYETAGGGSPFPTAASGIVITKNIFNLSGSSVRGIQAFDDAGGTPGATPIVVRDNIYNMSNSASTVYAVVSFGRNAIEVQGNTVNGTGTIFADPNGNNDLVFDIVYDQVNSISATTNVRSIVSSYINTYGTTASILYVYPSSGGSNYTSATTLSASGTGCTGWTGNPIIYGGVIFGVRTTANGSGRTGTATVTATDSGGGSGAVFVVGQSATFPIYKRIRWFSQGNLFLKSGGNVALANQSYPLQMGTGAPIELEAGQTGLFWNVVSYITPTYAIGSLPTCNTTSNGIYANVSGSTYGQWSARCNGTNWVFQDGALSTGGQNGWGAEQTVSFQPGLATSVSNTKGAFSKFLKASTVDNIEVSATAFTCTTNPTVTLYECGTSTSCATPTTIGSATITTTGTVVDGTISSSSITAGDYVSWAVSAGTCTLLNIAGTSQAHAN